MLVSFDRNSMKLPDCWFDLKLVAGLTHYSYSIIENNKKRCQTITEDRTVKYHMKLLEWNFASSYHLILKISTDESKMIWFIIRLLLE